MKTIKVHGINISVGDVVNTTNGRAELVLIGSKFTRWNLIEQKDIRFPFGRPTIVEDNNLNKFII